MNPKWLLQRGLMDINLNDLPHVIYARFVLHHFCEVSKETVDEQSVLGTIQGDNDPTHRKLIF